MDCIHLYMYVAMGSKVLNVQVLLTHTCIIQKFEKPFWLKLVISYIPSCIVLPIKQVEKFTLPEGYKKNVAYIFSFHVIFHYIAILHIYYLMVDKAI